MQSPIGATALLEPIPRKPISPKAAARFAARAFRPLLRFPTQTVRKPQALVALATIESPRACEKRRAASDLRSRPVEKDLSLASVRATSARWRHVPGPAFPVARSGVRIWRAEPIDARHGRAALLERGVAAVDRPVQAGAVIRAPTAVSTSTRGGRGQGQNNEGDQNEWDRAHDCLLDRSTLDPIFTLADFAFSKNI